MKLKLPSFKTKKAFEMAVSKDGRYLAHITSSALIIVDISTGKEIVQFKDLKNPSDIAFNQNGDLIAVKNTQGIIGVYNLNDFRLEKIINPNHGEGCNFLFSPDSQYLIDADWEGNISLIDFQNGLVKTLKHFNKCMIASIDYNPQTKKYLFLISPKASEQSGKIERENILLEWEYPFVKEPSLTNLPVADLRIAKYSLDGKYIAYSNNWQYKVKIYDWSLKEVVKEIETNRVKSIAWGKDKFGIVDGNTVRIYSFPDFTLLKEFDLDYACFIDFDGDFTMIGSWTIGFYLSLGDLIGFSME